MAGFDLVHIIRALAGIFRKQPVDFAYLFGSLATGNASKQSDIDVAIFTSGDLSKEERFALRLNLIGRLSRAVKRDVDVVVLNDLSSLFFRYVIISEGKLLYQRSEGRRLDFENMTLGLYFDFRPFLDLYNRRYVQRGLQ